MIAAAADFPYGHTAGLRRLTGDTVELTKKQSASFAAIKAEYDALEAQYSGTDELPDEISGRSSPSGPLREGVLAAMPSTAINNFTQSNRTCSMSFR
jgi:hypothetical protein